MISGISKIEFNSAGFKEILLSDGLKSLMDDVTSQITDRANANLTMDSEGYQGDVIESPRMSSYGSNGGRWVGFVRTTDYKSMEDEAENKTLSRAIL